jgi:hypothetical protein
MDVICIGGFVLTALHGLPRPTADVDFIEAVPEEGGRALLEVGGRGTKLAKKHGLYFQHVGVCDLPDDHRERLVELRLPHQHLRLLAVDVVDLVLGKLTRNSPKDRHDVRYLAERGELAPAVVEQRYREHLRPYLVNEERHDLTLELWLDEIRDASPVLCE